MAQSIIVKGLGKRFNRYSADRPLTIMEAALWGWWRMKPQARFWALRDVSFTVAPGEMLGILGKNGAGKSTLLQLVGGIGRAEEGTIKVNGRIGGLLDLGAGFHSDLTGRENVFVGAVVAGLTRREAARRFSDIVEFAELEQFIDSPLRTYSTGMKMRLAFSVAVHTDPEVLLVDEYLSVGDVAFQTKCLKKIEEFKTQGCAIVLISHSAAQIQKNCDRALWLREGKVVAYGET
ncbi:MAG: ABC transporter ATP-binding protein, partial [Richelia sp. CSU_2_1]|nr:ABC transporter ATP-binding protein [Richelia sp. CSU_2_1]